MVDRSRILGLFREIYFGEKDFPSMVPLLSNVPPADEPILVQYLKNGKMYSATMAIQTDFFHPEIQIDVMATMTDGTWFWPSVLAYYVEKYHLHLPDDFIDHVKRSTSISLSHGS